MQYDQISIFEVMDEPDYQMFKINPNLKVRLIEFFGGIGAQSMALRDLGIEFEHHRLIEFDKFPVNSYNAIHGTNFEPMDIRNVHGEDLGITETDKYFYIACYSFPCQDLSRAGKMRGMSKGSGTRSGLLWEVERILTELYENNMELPGCLVMENVTDVHGTSNIEDFKKWLDFLHSIGYTSYYDDLNAADYGIPQSRDRCFCVSMLGNYFYKFPKPIELKSTMKDYLEDEVPEWCYLKNDKARKLIDKLIVGGKILTDRQTDRQTDS